MYLCADNNFSGYTTFPALTVDKWNWCSFPLTGFSGYPFNWPVTSYTAGDDNVQQFYGVYQFCQTFTLNTKYPVQLSSVKLNIYRNGNPGSCTAAIKVTDGNGLPLGVDLGSITFDGNDLPTGAGTWTELTGFNMMLLPAVKYSLIISATSGNASNALNWRYDGTAPTYFGGCFVRSDNGGATWTNYDYDFMFAVYTVPYINSIELLLHTNASPPANIALNFDDVRGA
jgi:hypothetical protein